MRKIMQPISYELSWNKVQHGEHFGKISGDFLEDSVDCLKTSLLLDLRLAPGSPQPGALRVSLFHDGLLHRSLNR